MAKQAEDNASGLPCDIYKAILDQTYDGVYFVDNEKRITYWNKGAQSISGYQPEEVITLRCSDDLLCHIDAEGRSMCGPLCPLSRAVNGGQSTAQTRVYLKHKDGRRVPVDVVSSPISGPAGERLGAVQIFRDASIYEEEAKASELLSKLAAIDPLTELLNRRKIEMELDLELKKSKRLGLPLSLVFCDLDYFKHINDKYGHPVGDEVLKGVSRQLQAGIREYDRVARYGGEEFLIMLPQTKAEIAVEIADRLRTSIERWRLIHQEKLWPLNVTISMGVAEMNRDETLDSLIDRADKALYRAKQGGRNAVFVS
ncbi:MAG: sensor domain-containing diguanylate cyclase [bacterium]|nr:sensor domain-containing diguanylate cyclase [bacterium]